MSEAKLDCNALIFVEVAFADPLQQKIYRLELPANTTARQAVCKSGLADDFPTFDFDRAPLGVFGTKVPDNYLLTNHDRVEVYRPLVQSPRDARRIRANSKSKR